MPHNSDIWIKNPFSGGLLNKLSLLVRQEDSLAEVSTDSSIKLQFPQVQIAGFWFSVITILNVY